LKPIFDFLKPRSGKGEARKREREVARKIERLMEAKDEETFRAGLERDLGIKPDHPRFAEILKVWRGVQ
jgi:plasmid stabilization system protein ParE